MSSELALSAKEFELIRQLAYNQFGLDLKPGKETLVQARLGKRMRTLNLPSVQSYVNHVEADRTGQELAALIDALTTNHTSFLREPAHFDFLRDKIVPQIIKRSTLSLWCAGCATGEEIYTILFTLLESGYPGALKLLATDISNRALDHAKRGLYTLDRTASMPAKWKSRFLQAGQGEWAGHCRVRPALQSNIEFRRVNLMEPFTNIPQFPAIFCRNVMIYFDKVTQERLVQRFAERLEPGGYLMIGHSEGLMGVKHNLEYVMPATYKKPGTLK